MADYSNRGGDDNIYAGGGFGMWGIVIFLFLLFAIFSGGFFGRRDGDEHRRCGVCVEDESNWQEDRHLSDKACENTEKIIANQNHIAERQEDRYVRNLEMSNMQKDNYIQTLQIEKDYSGKFAGLYGAMEKGFCKTDHDIERLACELPKRQPVWAECVTPCVRDLDRGCERRERRDECFC